ncbi:MAG: magnesium/cobalt efflux protein [Legionellales bacterium]|nr:magnesium/cobalt efflux protein [Legionellales bacterium]|tara:strand:+ start:283 stop:1128 length:846 start_codon:yes stop_codon:yes gene_type:complete
MHRIYLNILKILKKILIREPSSREMLIEVLRNAENKNLLDADALLMIEGALHVSEIHVKDIMIPRVQMIIIKNDTKQEEILSSVVESGHSRFPVIGDTNDEIVGILLAKDLLNYYANPEKEFDIKDIMRPAVFIPESKRLNVLLREFRMSRNHMAIVIDEYSGVAGLVTIEDVIEEIIGEIEDEHDYEDDETNIKIHDNNRYTINALTTIDEFNNFFKTKLPDVEYETVGGFVISTFGYLPKRGETIISEGFNIKVLRADKRRVNLLLFTQNSSQELTENN